MVRLNKGHTVSAGLELEICYLLKKLIKSEGWEGVEFNCQEIG